jgi:hypothetical protein
LELTNQDNVIVVWPSMGDMHLFRQSDARAAVSGQEYAGQASLPGVLGRQLEHLVLFHTEAAALHCVNISSNTGNTKGSGW